MKPARTARVAEYDRERELTEDVDGRVTDVTERPTKVIGPPPLKPPPLKPSSLKPPPPPL
jgi:hypothetical protein